MTNTVLIRIFNCIPPFFAFYQPEHIHFQIFVYIPKSVNYVLPTQSLLINLPQGGSCGAIYNLQSTIWNPRFPKGFAPSAPSGSCRKFDCGTMFLHHPKFEDVPRWYDVIEFIYKVQLFFVSTRIRHQMTIIGDISAGMYPIFAVIICLSLFTSPTFKEAV